MGVDPTGMPLDPKAFTFEKGREAQLFDGRLIYIYITIYICTCFCFQCALACYVIKLVRLHETRHTQPRRTAFWFT